MGWPSSPFCLLFPLFALLFFSVLSSFLATRPVSEHGVAVLAPEEQRGSSTRTEEVDDVDVVDVLVEDVEETKLMWKK